MSEQMLLEARTVAKSRRTEVGAALKKALNMHLLHVGEVIPGGIRTTAVKPADENISTYRAPVSTYGALSQVRFQPGRVRG